MDGTFLANPENVTNKHLNQSTWKRVCFLDLGANDICAYYSWFMKRKYNLDILKPLRNPHVTVINDSIERFKGEDIEEKTNLWNGFCDKYNGQRCTVALSVETKGNGLHYWLNVTEESRNGLMVMRRELGLERPFSGMHMTIGRVKETDRPYSNYVLDLMKQ